MAKCNASDIAAWFVWYSNQHGDPISNLRLQKLLYYAQAWSLALNDEALFEEDFQAWIHGPVIPSVYGEYKEHGFGSIPSPECCDEETLCEPEIDADTKAHLIDLLESYGDLTARQLERLSHSEAPWRDARGGLAIDAPCKNVISKDAMKAFYKTRING